MPFQSKAQQGFMFAKHPGIAKRWANDYGVPKDLPEHKKKKTAMMEKETKMAFVIRLRELATEEQMKKQAMAGAARGALRGASGMLGKGFGALGRFGAQQKPGLMSDLLMGSKGQGMAGKINARGGAGRGLSSPASEQALGKHMAGRAGLGLGAGYMIDQNGSRRGSNSTINSYNNMGYLPKLMAALTNREIPTQSAFNPSWLLPGV